MTLQTTASRLSVQIRSVDRENLTVDIVASTPALDSYNTRIDQDGWDLETFKKNPVICYGHDAGGSWNSTPAGGLPVGNAIPETVRVEGGKLRMKVRFTPESVNPFGYRVFRMIEAGFIHGVSVGFEPLAWKDEENETDGRVRIFTKAKLMEVSIVTIPANDEAMVQRAKEQNRESELATFQALATEIETEAREKENEAREKEAEDKEDTVDPAYIAKCVSYYERRQPAFKIASRVMVKFYTKVLKQEQPDDEVVAWTRMGEVIDAMDVTEVENATVASSEEPEVVETEVTEVAPEVVEKTAEEVVAPETPETIVEVAEEIAAQVEETPEEPTIETPPAEAPQIEQKASVLLPLSVLKALPGAFMETAVEAAVKASRQGVPVGQLGGVVDELGKSLTRSFSPSK